MGMIDSVKDISAGLSAIRDIGRETRSRGHRSTGYIDDVKRVEVTRYPLALIDKNAKHKVAYEVDLFSNGKLPFNASYIQTNTIETFITQYENNVLSTLKVYNVKGDELELDKRLIKSLIRDVSIYGEFALVYDFSSNTFKKLKPWQVKGNEVYYPFSDKRGTRDGYIIEKRFLNGGTVQIERDIVSNGISESELPVFEAFESFVGRNIGIYAASIGKKPMCQIYELLRLIDIVYTEMKREMEKTATKATGTYEVVDEDGNANVNDDFYIKLESMSASDSDKQMFAIISPNFKIKELKDFVDMLKNDIVDILNVSSSPTTTYGVGGSVTATEILLKDAQFEMSINYINDLLFDSVKEYLVDLYDYTTNTVVRVEKGLYIKQNISLIADVIAKLNQSGAVSYKEMFNMKNKGADTERVLDELVRAKIERGITIIPNSDEYDHAVKKGYLNTADQFDNDIDI